MSDLVNEAIDAEEFILNIDSLTENLLNENQWKSFHQETQIEIFNNADNKEELKRIYDSLNKVYHSGELTNPYIRAHLEDYMDLCSKLTQFKNSSVIFENKEYDPKGISKKDLLIFTSEVSEISRDSIDALFTNLLANNNFNKVLSLVAIYIAEHYYPNDDNESIYKFKFSDNLEPLQFHDYLYSSSDPEVLIHEAYHLLQAIVFKGNEYIEGHYTEEKFNKSVSKTYKNIINLVNPKINITDDKDLVELKSILKTQMPEIEDLSYCNIGMRKVADSLCKDLNIDQIKIRSPENSFSLSDITSYEELTTKSIDRCDSIKAKYNLTQGHIDILERFSYYMECLDDNLDYSTTPDEECESGNFELMPSVFQLIAYGTPKEEMELLEPLLEYFEGDVAPLIDEYIEGHKHNHCSDESLSGKCIFDIDIFE